MTFAGVDGHVSHHEPDRPGMNEEQQEEGSRSGINPGACEVTREQGRSWPELLTAQHLTLPADYDVTVQFSTSSGAGITLGIKDT